MGTRQPYGKLLKEKSDQTEACSLKEHLPQPTASEPFSPGLRIRFESCTGLSWLAGPSKTITAQVDLGLGGPRAQGRGADTTPRKLRPGTGQA